MTNDIAQPNINLERLINYITGIVGSIVVVFALGEQEKLNQLNLFFSILIGGFTALIIMPLLLERINSNNRHNILVVIPVILVLVWWASFVFPKL